MENHKAGFPPFPLLLEIPRDSHITSASTTAVFFLTTGPGQPLPNPEPLPSQGACKPSLRSEV